MTAVIIVVVVVVVGIVIVVVHPGNANREAQAARNAIVNSTITMRDRALCWAICTFLLKTLVAKVGACNELLSSLLL